MLLIGQDENDHHDDEDDDDDDEHDNEPLLEKRTYSLWMKPKDMYAATSKRNPA